MRACEEGWNIILHFVTVRLAMMASAAQLAVMYLTPKLLVHTASILRFPTVTVKHTATQCKEDPACVHATYADC